MEGKSGNMNATTTTNKTNIEEDVNIRELLLRYLAYWKWFVISMVVCMSLAFLYLKATMPVYKVSSSIMIRDEQKGGAVASELTLLDGVDLMGKNTTENEVEVLRSKSLIRDVVKAINANVSYVANGFLSKSDLYDQSPVYVDQTQFRADELASPFVLHLNVEDSLDMKVTLLFKGEEISSEKYTSFPIILNTDHGVLVLSQREGHFLSEAPELIITISKPISVAKNYLAALTVAPASKTSAVVKLDFTGTNAKRGADFLDKLVEMYNLSAVEDKNKVALNTAIFIDERIKIIGKELGTSEREIESYKKREGLTDISSNATLFMKEGSEYERKRVENETQLNLIRFLKEYIYKAPNKEKVLPANIGLSDAGLLSQINKYNELLLDRNRLLRTTSDNNPIIVNQNAMLSALHENVKALIANVEESLVIMQNNLDKQTDKFKSQVGNVPTQERKYVEIDRQRQIQSSLFLMLLQKREENALAMAATTNKAKTIDESLAESEPVSPKGNMIYLVAFVLSVGIPVGILFLKDMFNVTFSSKGEIERQKLSPLPIVAEVPILSKTKDEVSEQRMAEVFRLLRTNIRFSLDEKKKVMLVTSSILGEGKTFISANLAINFSMLGKKTLIIGGDLRNPRLFEVLKKSGDMGLSTYLSGAEKDVFKVIQHLPEYPNLDVIFSGAIPPNPSELLSKELLETGMEQLRAVYDFIIIDSAPVGMVTDSLVLSRVADVTVYVCRADYTNKRFLEMVNQLSEEGKLPNVTLLVNAVDRETKRYGYASYGYGYGYGYGKYGKYGKYGYGYGYGYGGHAEKNAK